MEERIQGGGGRVQFPVGIYLVITRLPEKDLPLVGEYRYKEPLQGLLSQPQRLRDHLLSVSRC